MEIPLDFPKANDTITPMNNTDLLETLAEIEHDQWMAWAGKLMETETLSPERIERWKKCMVPYSELTEEMKKFDRDWARKTLVAVVEWNNEQTQSTDGDD